MTIVDRYILRSFLFNFLSLMFCFVGIFVVFDLFTNLDSLIQSGKAAHNIPKVIALYYLYKSIPIVMMLGSILGLVSAMVTAATFMRNNELIPIQAAGITLLRIVRPLVYAVIAVAGLFVLMRETVLPNIQDQLTMQASDFAEDKGVLCNVTIDNETNVSIIGDRVFRSEKRMTEPEFVIPKPIAKQTLRLEGGAAFQKAADNTHPAGYLLTDIAGKSDILQESSIQYEGKPIVITPKDADWLKSNECFIVSNVPFECLASSNAWQYASFWSLVSAVQNQSIDTGTPLEATIHNRLTQPILDITLLFLGLPLILTGGDRNIFKAIGLSGCILILFLAVCYSCQYLGANNEMPVLGAWLPLILFVPLGVNQYVLLMHS